MESPADPRFPQTQWTILVDRIREDGPHSFEALSRLCEDYWYPLYAFARREGASPESAADEIQGFFAALVERDFLGSADRRKGRLRSFLIDAFRKFRAKEFRARQAQKRGGKATHLSIDNEVAEGRYEAEVTDDLTPEQLLDRSWALALLRNVMTRLEEDFDQIGKKDEFDALSPFLVRDSEGPTYAEVASRMGISEGNFKVKVHRFRKSYRNKLESLVRDTLDPEATDSEVSAEIRDLFHAFS